MCCVACRKRLRCLTSAGASRATAPACFFSVIAVAQDLPDIKHHRAVEAGPPFVDAPKAYVDLLADSGWLLKKRIDVTAEHRKSLSALVKAFDENAALRETLGHDAINESRRGRQGTNRGTRRGGCWFAKYFWLLQFSRLLKNFFGRLRQVHGCTAIFGGCKPLKMGVI